MLKFLPAVAVTALLVPLAMACGDDDDDGLDATLAGDNGGQATEPGDGESTFSVDLDGVNGSDVSGQAEFEAMGSSTMVRVIVDDPGFSGAAAIYTGTCASIDGTPVQMLSQAGAGETIPWTVDELTSGGLVIVVLDETAQPAACGEISA